MWGRGLKLSNQSRAGASTSVAPYMGAWIETKLMPVSAQLRLVAPYMGAWIETRPWHRVATSCIMSHPIWVRGLKQRM